MPEYGEDYIVLNVSNSPMTMAEGNTGTDYERQLNRLDCFFYVKDKTNDPCVYYHRVDINNLASAKVSFFVNDLLLKEIYPSGSLCDVFVIANLPADYTFEAKTAETTKPALGQLVLDMTEGKYDVIGKPFIMTGDGKVQKGKNSNATATISLARVASKVTMTVKVPKSIEVGSDENKVTMLPVLEDNVGNEPLKTSFHYGTKKSYLSGAYPDDPDNYINTDKIPYTLSEAEETETHYVFTCDMPFYTYARSWDKGSDNAAYVTFEMPWGADENKDGKADSYKTFYYQILVNGRNRNFVPNTCYDMIVTVGVLGSTVEALPKELDELSYYVLDWTTETSNGEHGSGDRNEDVVLDKYNYLEVPQKYIEMDNVSEVAIRYNASHKIGVEFNAAPPTSVVGLANTGGNTAFYINNGSGTPQVAPINNIDLKTNFIDNNKGTLTFKYTLSDDVYSPAYVFITIWLDDNGNGVHDSDETLTEDVTIVIYPAIYIVGEKSANFSVFVNGYYNGYNRQQPSTNGNSGTEVPYLNITDKNNVKHQVGKAYGYDSNPNQYTHIISVSSFTIDSKFDINKDSYSYCIGDPRVRSPYLLDVPNANTTTPNTNANGWMKAVGVDGKARELTYYYPTSTKVDEGAFQVIAPKFRISSKLAGYSHCSIDDLAPAIRCASYQEDGFPAGRWRLPTTAEVQFVIMLQNNKKIQELFVGESNYCSATHTINNNNNTIQIWDGIQKGTNNKSTVSVRCVYDEWYWGSKREAIPNSSLSQNGGYQFTWGDRKVY
ncbi:MAG: hypothetical protein IKV06_06910 [Alistipes sp.]|nr:hypothetical protein [Alistipes sp.]